MTPKVSVVIKSYNHAAFVHQTIQSVLDQSFQDFEIVVTDDASTDGTADIVRQFDDPRISLQVLPRNHGISIAMNTTLARARGEYMAILNSDDFALPERLQRQVEFLDANPGTSLVFGLPLPVGDDGLETKGHNDFNIPFSLPDFSQASFLRQFFFGGNCLCAPTAMIRRSAYQEVGDYDPRLTNLQDFDMWIRMLKAGKNIHVLPAQVTAFRIRSGNANMSAPRPDSHLRTQFEFSQILKQYSTMAPELLEETFAGDLAQRGISPAGKRHEVWLAELALTIAYPPYSLFALQLLFDTAMDVEDFSRLRELAGQADVFGFLALSNCNQEIARLNRAWGEQRLINSWH